MSTLLASVKDIKELIALASSTQEADGYVLEFTSYRTIEEKLEFVSGLFNAKIIGRSDLCREDDSGEIERIDDYEATLNAIINKKWR